MGPQGQAHMPSPGVFAMAHSGRLRGQERMGHHPCPHGTPVQTVLPRDFSQVGLRAGAAASDQLLPDISGAAPTEVPPPEQGCRVLGGVFLGHLFPKYGECS